VKTPTTAKKIHKTMRTNIMLCVSLFFILLQANAQTSNWSYKHLTYPDATPLKEAHFWGDTGIVITYPGYIYRSNDLFQTYTVDSSFVPKEFLEGSCFINKDTGYAISRMFTTGITRTTNGGSTWDSVPFNSGSYRAGILRISKDLKFAITSDYISGWYQGTMASYSHDGGYSWLSNDLYGVPGCRRITQMHILNDTTVCAFCNTVPQGLGQPVLVKSTDKGVTWQRVTLPAMLDGNTDDFCFIDDTTVIATSFLKILKSRNGGVTFDTVYQSPFYFDYLSDVTEAISFVNRDTGYLAFRTSVYRTYDAGNTWQRTDFSMKIIGDYIRYIKALSATKVVVGTQVGFLYYTETGGGIWSSVEEVEERKVTLHPNPATTHITITGAAPNTTATITNLHGQVVLQSEIRNPQSEISVDALPPGLYFCILQSGQERKVLRFVKQ
jgi:photosystem II stability/assembly factor-like uncharacterized protein